jgi:elongation factor P hydroxylase
MAVVEIEPGVFEDECPHTRGAHVWVRGWLIGENYDWCGCGVNRHTKEDGSYWYSRRVK